MEGVFPAPDLLIEPAVDVVELPFEATLGTNSLTRTGNASSSIRLWGVLGESASSGVRACSLNVPDRRAAQARCRVRDRPRRSR